MRQANYSYRDYQNPSEEYIPFRQDLKKKRNPMIVLLANLTMLYIVYLILSSLIHASSGWKFFDLTLCFWFIFLTSMIYVPYGQKVETFHKFSHSPQEELGPGSHFRFLFWLSKTTKNMDRRMNLRNAYDYTKHKLWSVVRLFTFIFLALGTVWMFQWSSYFLFGKSKSNPKSSLAVRPVVNGIDPRNSAANYSSADNSYQSNYQKNSSSQSQNLTEQNSKDEELADLKTQNAELRQINESRTSPSVKSYSAMYSSSNLAYLRKHTSELRGEPAIETKTNSQNNKLNYVAASTPSVNSSEKKLKNTLLDGTTALMTRREIYENAINRNAVIKDNGKIVYPAKALKELNRDENQAELSEGNNNPVSYNTAYVAHVDNRGNFRIYSPDKKDMYAAKNIQEIHDLLMQHGWTLYSDRVNGFEVVYDQNANLLGNFNSLPDKYDYIINHNLVYYVYTFWGE